MILGISAKVSDFCMAAGKRAAAPQNDKCFSPFVAVLTIEMPFAWLQI